MLRRGHANDLRKGLLTREHGYLVAAMRTYPRFVPRSAIDEYTAAMSPSRLLFGELRDLIRKQGDHNLAFEEVDFEARFTLTRKGLDTLQRLVRLSRERDVYLICQCAEDERCHVDMLLMAARHLGAEKCEPPRHDYPVWRDRLAADDYTDIG